jgi:hypothetical protein
MAERPPCCGETECDIRPRGRQAERRRNVADEPRQVAFVGTARVATRGNRQTVSTGFWASRIACRAFAHVCSIIRFGERTAASFRWIRRSRHRCAIDNLVFADRSEATVVDQKNRVGRQRIGLRIVTRVAPRTAAEGASRSRSNGSEAVSRLWYATPEQLVSSRLRPRQSSTACLAICQREARVARPSDLAAAGLPAGSRQGALIYSPSELRRIRQLWVDRTAITF